MFMNLDEKNSQLFWNKIKNNHNLEKSRQANNF